MRFLIADDQIHARDLLCRIVSSNPSWSLVAEASDGEEVIARMDKRPDVVLMDIVMPVIDGLEVTRQIKCMVPSTVVILTTAYPNREFGMRSLKAGADGFIFKDDLTVETLQEILKSKGGVKDECPDVRDAFAGNGPAVPRSL